MDSHHPYNIVTHDMGLDVELSLTFQRKDRGQNIEFLLEMLAILHRGKRANRFEELIELSYSSTGIKIRLRYYDKDLHRQVHGERAIGYENELLHWYVKYLIGQIDKLKAIVNPFPVDLELIREDSAEFDTD